MILEIINLNVTVILELINLNVFILTIREWVYNPDLSNVELFYSVNLRFFSFQS